MNIEDLLYKPVWQMAGEELLFLACQAGVATKRAISRAITQIGRKIIIDADLALEPAGRKKGGRG